MLYICQEIFSHWPVCADSLVPSANNSSADTLCGYFFFQFSFHSVRRLATVCIYFFFFIPDKTEMLIISPVIDTGFYGVRKNTCARDIFFNPFLIPGTKWKAPNLPRFGVVNVSSHSARVDLKNSIRPVNGSPESHLFRWNRDVIGGDNPPPTFGCARENSGPSSRVFWGGEVGMDVSFCRPRAANARRFVSACGGNLDMYRDPRSVPSHPCVSSLRSNLDPTIDECYLNWVVLTFPAVSLGV